MPIRWCLIVATLAVIALASASVARAAQPSMPADLIVAELLRGEGVDAPATVLREQDWDNGVRDWSIDIDDFNGDGFADLGIPVSQGACGVHETRTFHLYDPTRRDFVEGLTLQGSSFDRAKRQLIETLCSNCTCSGGTETTYQFKGLRAVKLRTRSFRS